MVRNERLRKAAVQSCGWWICHVYAPEFTLTPSQTLQLLRLSLTPAGCVHTHSLHLTYTPHTVDAVNHRCGYLTPIQPRSSLSLFFTRTQPTPSMTLSMATSHRYFGPDWKISTTIECHEMKLPFMVSRGWIQMTLVIAWLFPLEWEWGFVREILASFRSVSTKCDAAIHFSLLDCDKFGDLLTFHQEASSDQIFNTSNTSFITKCSQK